MATQQRTNHTKGRSEKPAKTCALQFALKTRCSGKVLHGPAQGVERAESRFGFGEERCVGVYAEMDKGIVDVHNAKALTLKFQAEKGVFVAILCATRIETNALENVTANKQIKPCEVTVGMFHAILHRAYSLRLMLITPTEFRARHRFAIRIANSSAYGIGLIAICPISGNEVFRANFSIAVKEKKIRKLRLVGQTIAQSGLSSVLFSSHVAAVGRVRHCVTIGAYARFVCRSVVAKDYLVVIAWRRGH